LESDIIVDELNIINFDFSESFNTAIEAKVTAEQNALAAKNKLEQVKFEAQQAVESAKGKAEAITVEATALKDSPQLIELRKIEKWNGTMPQYVGAGVTPFIDISK
jgi:regulator of protease activity HflC (stomatin/prohibitin superfamily)